jgi:hypothetical protein
MAALMLLLVLAARLTPTEPGYKMVAPLAALRNPGGADDGHCDEKKLRVDNPARIDCGCILKSCKKCWGERTGDDFMGVKGLGTTDQKRIGIGMRSRKRSLGQDWLMGALDGRKVESSAQVAWSQANQRSRGQGCVVKKLEDRRGKGSVPMQLKCGAMDKVSKGQPQKTRANGYGNGKGCETTTEEHRGRASG